MTNTVYSEKIVEVESEKLKQEFNEAERKIARLERTNNDNEKITNKYKDENEKLKSEIQRYGI